MDLRTMLELIAQYGLPIVLVVYFIWRDYEREKRNNLKESAMQAHVQGLEKEMRSLLINLVERTSCIIVANSQAMQDWLAVLKIRPCLADEIAKKVIEETLIMAKESNKE